MKPFVLALLFLGVFSLYGLEQEALFEPFVPIYLSAESDEQLLLECSYIYENLRTGLGDIDCDGDIDILIACDRFAPAAIVNNGSQQQYSFDVTIEQITENGSYIDCKVGG